MKITDFGLAKLAQVGSSNNLTRTQQVMGTPQYMAPEQIERPRDVDHRADIYAMGVVFYELLTGELPLGRFDPPSRKSGTSRRLDRVVMKTLQKDPAKRFEQVSEVKTEVEKEPKNQTDSKNGPRKWVDAAVEKAAEAKEKAVEFADLDNSYSDIIVGGLATGTYLSLIAGFFALTAGPAGLLLIAIAAFGWWATLRLLTRDPVSTAVEKYCRPLSLATNLPQLGRSSNEVSAVGVFDEPGRTQARYFVLILLGLGFAAWFFGAPLLSTALFIAGTAIARFIVGRLSAQQRSTADKWCLYPPILCVVIPALVLLAFWPTIGVIIMLADFPYSGRFFGNVVPLSRMGPFIGSVGFTIQFAWLALLGYLAGRFPTAARFAGKPLIETWNGGGAYIASFMALVASVVFLSIAVTKFAE